MVVWIALGTVGTLVLAGVTVIGYIYTRPKVKSLEAGNVRVRKESFHDGQQAPADMVFIEVRADIQAVVSDDVDMDITARVKPTGRNWNQESVQLGLKHVANKTFHDSLVLGGLVSEIQTRVTTWDLEITVKPTGGRKKRLESVGLRLNDGRPEADGDA